MRRRKRLIIILLPLILLSLLIPALYNQQDSGTPFSLLTTVPWSWMKRAGISGSS